jgi:hypothetical protein
MIRAPYVDKNHPYSSRTGKLATRLLDSCPNEKCESFYQKQLKIGLNPWVWIGNFSPKS